MPLDLRDVRDTAAGCMAPDLHFETPPTPERIKLFRRSYNEAPGRRVLHPGIEFDWDRTKVQDLNTHRFGRKAQRATAEGVGKLMSVARTTELSSHVNSKAEECYKSTKREPLGKPMARPYVVPAKCNAPGFMFGIASERAEDESAAALVRPSDDVAKAHIKSSFLRRGTTEGDAADRIEQRPTDRHYNWNQIGVNPDTHSFGFCPEKKDEGGVAAALTGASDITLGQDSEYRRKHAFRLGQGKVKEGRIAELPSEHRYGRPKTEADKWGAADCLGGMYSKKEQEPDSDLGKSRRRIKCNLEAPEDSSRVFGVPSTRSDLEAPEVPSVADMINYGNEPTGGGLLYPERFAYTKGVTVDDFGKKRSAGEMRTVFASALGNDFNSEIYERAVCSCGQYGGTPTVQTMMEAYNKHC